MSKTKILQKFEVNGTLHEHGHKRKFSKTIMAYNEKNAMEKTLALFGSKNKIVRRQIDIEECKAVRGAKK